MNKKLLVWILAAMIAAPSAAFAGILRRQPANLGTARVGSQAPLFIYSFDNGSVTATGSADWALGLVLDAPATKVVLPAMATTAGAVVRIVTSGAAGNQIGATAFQPLPVTTVYQTLSFFPIASGDFVFVDAIMNAGASILGVEFNE